MMNDTKFIELGKIKKAQGIQGDIIVELYKEINPKISKLYINLTDEDSPIKNMHVAYNIEKLEFITSTQVKIKFREISEKSQANFLSGKNIYIKSAGVYINDTNMAINSYQLAGYQLFNKNNESKSIGKIVGIRKVEENHLEKMVLLVEYDDNQIIPIPFQHDIDINHGEKLVSMTLPDEFLEVLLTNQ